MHFIFASATILVINTVQMMKLKLEKNGLTFPAAASPPREGAGETRAGLEDHRNPPTFQSYRWGVQVLWISSPTALSPEQDKEW